jgi:hypothetical protein
MLRPGNMNGHSMEAHRDRITPGRKPDDPIRRMRELSDEGIIAIGNRPQRGPGSDGTLGKA